MTSPELASGPRLVLIVDDVPDNRNILDRYLKTGGYVTALAESGREALSIMSKARPDIVLLDWMMPGFSGLETLRAIRERFGKNQLPVIMCSALGEEESVVSALDAGANDYMVKPISPAILRARMRTHLDQRSSFHELTVEKDLVERRFGEQARAAFMIDKCR